MSTTTESLCRVEDPHPILGFARALHGALGRVLGSDPVFLTGDDKRAALLELIREQHRLDALVLRVLAAADLDDVGALDGSASTGAWLSHHTHADRPDAMALVRLANDLDRERTETARELAQGSFSTEHARIIVWAVDRLPTDLPEDVVARAEKVLVEEAHHLSPAQLRVVGKHLLEVVAPDLADELLRQQLERDERAAHARARFSTRSNGDGTTQGWFRVPDLHAGILKAALDAITAPRKAPAEDRVDPDTGRPLDRATLLGQGLCELIEHLPVDRLGDHGRTAATIVVTLSHETLTTGLGAAGLTGGGTLSAGEARRLACTAGIIPAVLGKASATLDLGREARFFTKAQRTALDLRDRGCRAETCDRPAAWCEAHHANQPWADGGRTDLRDGILLCGHHHRLAHNPTYDQRRMPNGDLRFARRC